MTNLSLVAYKAVAYKKTECTAPTGMIAVETQNIILDPKKRVGALLKFRVQETRKTCKIFIEMEEVLPPFQKKTCTVNSSKRPTYQLNLHFVHS